MQSELFDSLSTDATLAVFVPDQRAAEFAYFGLRCVCGGSVFHLSGWPRVVAGPGGFFWRTLTRVWREARLVVEDGEPVESPFWLPVFACCDACGRDACLFDHARVAGRRPMAERSEPRESFRCRVCRRGAVALVAGWAEDACGRPGIAVELVTHCDRCRRQARVAWSDGRASEQQVRLDLLYGRR